MEGLFTTLKSACKLILLISLLALPTNAFPTGHIQEPFDIRKAYWGMDPTEVALSEGRRPDVENYGNDGLLQYKYHKKRLKGGTLYHVGTWHYRFSRGHLVKVFYTASWRKDHLIKYNRAYQHLIKKYGQPIATRDQIQGVPMTVHEWMVEDQTFIQIRLEKEASSLYNDRHYQALFMDVEYKEKEKARKAKKAQKEQATVD